MRPRSSLLVLYCVFAGIQAIAQTGIFLEPPLTPVQGIGTYGEAMATGDFNGDGKTDLVVTTSSGLIILLGSGDGSFQPKASYPFANGPLSFAVGDFNGDGKLDLAVTAFNSGTVSVMFGNGDGTFQAPVSYGTGVNPSAAAVGDFNGDGKLDFAVVNNGSSSVSIFLNSGTGAFPSRQDFATATMPYAIVVEDFRNDGKLDLAVTDCSQGPGSSCKRRHQCRLSAAWQWRRHFPDPR